VTKVFI